MPSGRPTSTASSFTSMEPVGELTPPTSKGEADETEATAE